MLSATTLNTANIFSVFTSIQGEGIYLGVPQIFIRFSGCNIRCDYCDTTEALSPQSVARIEGIPFSGTVKLVSNPLPLEMLVESVRKLAFSFGGFHSISLTGGEPLLYNGFLRQLLPKLKKTELLVFLETNGTLPDQLIKVIDLVDIISMDIKIPSTIKNGELDWGKTEDFLKIALERDCYVKIVVPDPLRNGATKISSKELEEEFVTARDIIVRVKPEIPVVLQPASTSALERNNGCGYSSLNWLLEVYRIFSEKLNDVRIIPQVHKLIGWK